MSMLRVTVARNTVTQPGAMRTMKSFVVVRAAPKSGIRTRSNATCKWTLLSETKYLVSLINK